MGMPRSEEELRAKRDELMLRDVGQIAALENYRVDLDKDRQVDLTFWAPNEEVAKAFAEACVRNEMHVHTLLGPGASETNKRWLIRTSCSASPRYISAKENVVTFLLFGDKYDCEYDGWGTAVVEARTN